MANILKIKNEQGEWTDIPSIKGDAGPQGPVGPQGPKGDPGEVTTQQMTDYVAQELVSKQDKLDSYSDSASVADDKLTINYKVKQEDGTYSNVPVEFSGGSNYTFTDGLTETNGTVKLGGKLSTDNGVTLKANGYYGNFITFDNNESKSNHHYITIQKSYTSGFDFCIDGYSLGLSLKISGKSDNSSKIYSTLPIIPSGFNEQSINIDLGNNEHKWRTLYCDNLSDGTTTKTMTDVLANSVAKYRHMIKLEFEIGELGPDVVYETVNLDWINSVSTPYTSLTDLLNEIKSKVAAEEFINCSGIWPEIEIKNGRLSRLGFSNSIRWYTTGGTDKLFVTVTDNSHYNEQQEFYTGDREITAIRKDIVIPL